MCEFYSSAYKTIYLFVKCIRVNAYCSLAVFIANYRRCPRRDVSAIVMCLQDHGFESWSRCLVHQCYISGINGDHYLNYEVCPARCTPKTACCFLLQTKAVYGKTDVQQKGVIIKWRHTPRSGKKTVLEEGPPICDDLYWGEKGRKGCWRNVTSHQLAIKVSQTVML